MLDDTTYLYIGIVGATSSKGKSKRTLTMRLLEEQKDFAKRCNVDIKKFRYCSINSCNNIDVSILLKTVEMSSITILTSLFNCDNSKEHIEALFKDEKIKLLNRMTSYKYVE